MFALFLILYISTDAVGFVLCVHFTVLTRLYTEDTICSNFTGCIQDCTTESILD